VLWVEIGTGLRVKAETGILAETGYHERISQEFSEKREIRDMVIVFPSSTERLDIGGSKTHYKITFLQFEGYQGQY
jgi:hypothetical protein